MKGTGSTSGLQRLFTDIVESKIIRESAFVLAQAAVSVGSPQIRNRGTVGGNIVKGSPAADSVPALVALEARLRLVSGAGEGNLGIEEFLVGVCKTAILPGEVLVDISFKALAPKTGSAFVKLGRRNALAISRVSVAAIIGYDEVEMTCTDCRISVGSVKIRFGSERPKISGRLQSHIATGPLRRSGAQED